MVVQKKVKVTSLYVKAKDLGNDLGKLIGDTLELIGDRMETYATLQRAAKRRVEFYGRDIESNEQLKKSDPDHAATYKNSIQKVNTLMGAYEKIVDTTAKGQKDLSEIHKDLDVLKESRKIIRDALALKEINIRTGQALVDNMKGATDYMKDIAGRLAQHDKALAGRYMKVADDIETVTGELIKAAPKPGKGTAPSAKKEAAHA